VLDLLSDPIVPSLLADFRLLDDRKMANRAGIGGFEK
jgi:hypothetical protein